jgi:hypothetical protein
VKTVYRQYTPELPDPCERPTTEAAIEEKTRAMRASGLFSSVEVCTHPWAETYTTAGYLRLLNTCSGHRAIPEERRRGLYQAIAELIESHYEGKVEKSYLIELNLGKRPSYPVA